VVGADQTTLVYQLKTLTSSLQLPLPISRVLRDALFEELCQDSGWGVNPRATKE